MIAWTVRLARWYFSRVPLEKGKWSAWRWFISSTAYTSFAPGVYKTAYGFPIHLDPSENIDRFIYFWGAWEPDEAWLIDRLLRPGDIFVDVGANEGFHTLVASRRVGPTGRVVAFEPVPPTIERLKRNLQLNHVQNVDLIAAACTEEGPTPVKLARRTDEKSSSVYSMRTPDTGDSWLVDGLRMDDALGHLQGRVRLVKIDIEGAEMLALRGFSEHIARNDAPAVLCEVTETFLKAMGSSALELYGFMSSFGYQPYRLRGRRLTLLSTEEAKRQFQLNVLFAKAEPPMMLMQ